MAGTSKKRAAPESPAVATRASKAAKVGNGDVSKAQPKSAKGKKAMPTSDFKKKALPLHVHITHTPPALDKSKEQATLSKDVGQIGAITMIPTNFSTGSYGWKGNKRTTVELVGSEGNKEKVQVMFTFNATVVGSKDAEGAKDGADGEAKDAGEEDDEEAKEAEAAATDD